MRPIMQSDDVIAQLASYDPGAYYVPEHDRLQSEADQYWTWHWDGAEGSELIVDLWSGAVSLVLRDTGSKDCTTSERQKGNSILDLPELRAKMEKRFGWLAQSYTEMRATAEEAGIGASSLQSLPSSPTPLGTTAQCVVAPSADLQSMTEPPGSDCKRPMGICPLLTWRWLDDYIKLKATCRILHELEALQACLHRRGELRPGSPAHGKNSRLCCYCSF